MLGPVLSTFKALKRDLVGLKDDWNIGWYLKPLEGMRLSSANC